MACNTMAQNTIENFNDQASICSVDQLLILSELDKDGDRLGYGELIESTIDPSMNKFNKHKHNKAFVGEGNDNFNENINIKNDNSKIEKTTDKPKGDLNTVDVTSFDKTDIS